MPPGQSMLGPNMRMSRGLARSDRWGKKVSRRMQQLGILVRNEFCQGQVASRCAHVVLARGRHGATQGFVNQQTAYCLREVPCRERHAQPAAPLAQDTLLVGVVVGDDRNTQGQVLYDFGRRAGVQKAPPWTGSEADFRRAHVSPRFLDRQPPGPDRCIGYAGLVRPHSQPLLLHFILGLTDQQEQHVGKLLPQDLQHVEENLYAATASQGAEIDQYALSLETRVVREANALWY